MNISVIVPVFNAEKTLPRCLDSLLNQGLDDDALEIICVDDGSDDGSLDLLATYAAHYTSVKIFSKQHEGVAAARNLGLQYARGEVVAFCDADDYLLKGAYAWLLANFWVLDLDLLTFWSVTIDAYSINHLDEFNKLEGEVVYEGSGWTFYKEHNYRFSCCLHLFRRAFLEQHHLRFKSRIIGEDVQFCLDVHHCDPFIKEVNCRLYRYVSHPDQSIAKRSPKMLRIVLQDYQKVLTSFHELGLQQYVGRELVPMVSRMLSADLAKDDYLQTKNNLMRIKALPSSKGGKMGLAIDWIFKSYLLYRVAGWMHRTIVVPYVLPKMHRNAGI